MKAVVFKFDASARALKTPRCNKVRRLSGRAGSLPTLEPQKVTRRLDPLHWRYVARRATADCASHCRHSASVRRRNAYRSWVTVPNSNSPRRYTQRSSAPASFHALDPRTPSGMISESDSRAGASTRHTSMARGLLSPAYVTVHSRICWPSECRCELLYEPVALALAVVAGVHEA